MNEAATIGTKIVCTSCGAINRIPAERDARAARCGSCKSPLFSGEPVDVSGEMFERQLARGDLPVVVDVWAPWCGPCHAMAPEYRKAASGLEPRVRFLKLNSDQEQAIAGRLGIRGIPTMILFRGGREVARVSGAMNSSRIVDWIRSHL